VDAFVLDEGPGTPLITARHAGRTLDPDSLQSGARTADVAAIAHDVLAPLTPRFSVRDLAAALKAPVVLALDAEAGVTAHARSAAEAVRTAGLPVVAVILAGWPDPPPRVLLDERVVLHEVTGLPVLTLAAGETPDWPLDEWRAFDPRAAAAAATTDGPVAQRVALEPYRAWAGVAPGDPRETPRPRIMDALQEIVAAEGPMLASRAYALFVKSSGGKKVTTVAKAPLTSATYWLAREGRLELTEQDEAPWQDEDQLRLPDTPPVVVRELGPRELVEVPLDEIAELMRRLLAAGHRRDDLKRSVLTAYGLVRLTTRADEYLGRALDLLED
jgi:hypothetical protein